MYEKITKWFRLVIEYEPQIYGNIIPVIGFPFMQC